MRITLLGGDVHLCSVGEFYTDPKQQIPREQDYRYIPNVISSAIVNTPPAETVSNILSKRNKVHHLDSECHETQVPVFQTDVTGRKLNNPCLLPRRNWCSISHSSTTGALDVEINVEVDQSRDDGRTRPYSYTIPRLDLVPHIDRFTQGISETQQPTLLQTQAPQSITNLDQSQHQPRYNYDYQWSDNEYKDDHGYAA